MATLTATPKHSLRERLVALTRRQPDQVAILVMAVLGVAVSLYLTAAHYAKAPLLCSTNGLVDCASVLTSAYAVVPGTPIPITFPGLLWFVVSGGLTVWGLRGNWRGEGEPSWLRQSQQAWGALGLVVVLYLVSVEIDHLHHLCAWCTGVHLLVLGTLLVSLYFRTIPKYDRKRAVTMNSATAQRSTSRMSSAPTVRVSSAVPIAAHPQRATTRAAGKKASSHRRSAR